MYFLDRNPNKEKFQSRKGIFVGYAENSKAYRIWIPDEHRIDITRDAEFMATPKSSNQEDNNRCLNKELTDDRMEVEFPIVNGTNEDQIDEVDDHTIEDDHSVDRNEELPIYRLQQKEDVEDLEK